LAAPSRSADCSSTTTQPLGRRPGRTFPGNLADLIIAATAELAGLTVLHLDKDFEVIAQITGQPVERLNIQQ
jgi:hypothetical protein